MSMILMVHTEHTCKEYVLPCLYDSDFSIVLLRQSFGFLEDISISLEVIENNWNFTASSTYWILKQNQPYFGETLKNGDILDFLSERGERAAIIVCEKEEQLNPFQKYDISGISKITIGKEKENSIVYDFYGLVSRRHGLLYRKGTDWFVQDYSANGIFFESQRIEKERRIGFGESIHIFGLKLLVLGDALCIDGIGKVEVKEELPVFKWKEEKKEVSQKNKKKKEEFFHRSPRTMPVLYKEPIQLAFPSVQEYERELQERVSIMAFGRFQIYWKKRKNGALQQPQPPSQSVYLEKQIVKIKEKYQENQRILRESYPSATICCDYDQNTSTLWNRNFSHKDILFLRLGLGQRPFEAPIEMTGQAVSLQNREQGLYLKEQYKNLTDVPVGIDLFEHPLCGIIGGKKKQGAYQVAKLMLAQICANICYTDVKVAVLYNETSEEERKKWEFAKWLPHIWNQEKNMRFFARNREEAREVCFELAAIFRKRAEGAKEMRPHYILFLADPELLEGELLEKYVYENKPEYGLSCCLLVENYEDLPNCCGQIIQKDEKFSGMYHVMEGWEKRTEIVFDQVPSEKWEMFSRRIAGIRVKEEREDRKIPKSLTFLEMYGVDHVEQLQIVNRWRKQRTYESMRVCIGKKAGDRLCFLDIHENYHGPHGLLAGTTGSGKSETIQTFLLSLALNFSPRDVSFLLIDYKGGGMARQFSRLPHLAGQISNLSGNQIRRAMISIQSEIERRQRLFQTYGVTHIHTYTKLLKTGKVKEELAHLCIVVDEFAELKKEEPEFLRELISVAQVGRSLGIHLLLATQKPCGTVDANIWSNSHFHICLRVQSEEDSMEVLKREDAAFLTRAGQGYLQVGKDEVYEKFQTGWSGAVYGNEKEQRKAVMLTGNGREAWTGICSSDREEGMEEQERSELDVLVEYMEQLADEYGFGRSRTLWLPPLPQRILLEELEEKKAEKGRLLATVGLCDDVRGQRQIPYQVDFTKDGHCGVIGTVSSGKSSLLQGMVWSMLRNYTPECLHLYLLDFGNGMLSVFQDAPQVGGVILEQELEKLEKFMYFLQKKVRERKVLIKGSDYTQYVQSTENTLPALVIVIDNMAAFRERTEEKYTDSLYSILREAPACGIYFLIAAGGFGVHEIPGRMQDFIKTRIALGLADQYKYMEILQVSQISFLPEKESKGRGLVEVEGKTMELQIALAGGEDVKERGQHLEKWCRQQKQEWKGICAEPIPEIPKNPTLEQFRLQKEYETCIRGGTTLPVGYHGMESGLLSMDIWTEDHFLIGGRKGSGRKNVAKVLMDSAKYAGGTIYVFGTKKGALKEYAKNCSAEYLEDTVSWYECFNSLMPEWKKRNLQRKRVLERGICEEERQTERTKATLFFLVIEDLYDFLKQIYEVEDGNGNMKHFLENVIEKGAGNGICWIGIWDVEDMRKCMAFPAFLRLAKEKTGIYLGGRLLEQKIFSYDNVTFEEEQKETDAGSGYLFSRSQKNKAIPIVVPLVQEKEERIEANNECFRDL